MNKYGLKNHTKISNAIDRILYTQLQELSKETQIPLSKLVVNAIKLLLDKYKTAE